MSEAIQDPLFPQPTRQSASTTVPRTWPGVSPTSTSKLQSILIDNHKKWHIFFDPRGFHNHIPHTILTLWCLGADPAILEASYKLQCAYQLPAYVSPSPITHATWRNHLGDESYYQAYLTFFDDEVKDKSFGDLLEEYIFAPDANFVEGSNTDPEMLTRFLGSLFHPFIHTGFGVEFQLPGIFAEGLAQAAVHKTEFDSARRIPPLYFQSTGDSLASKITKAVGLADERTSPAAGTHAFTILARILKDPRFACGTKDGYGFSNDAVAKDGGLIREYVDQWTLEGDISKKIEELIWTNALIYGVGGNEKSGVFNADFIYMHLVTSSIFLLSVHTQLKRSSQELLLRGYFAVSLTWYVGHDRAALDIARFFKDPALLHPTTPGPQPTPHKDAIPSQSSPKAITPNPWLAVLQSTLTHPDEHISKLQRALSEFASLFGTTQAGHFQGTELKDAELIDGSLFLRTAGLSAARLGWTREGGAPLEGTWDRRGFTSPDDTT
ncbi:hypothetical protein B0H34DRAFT_293036 [Crassisporium funariophilum]|nr:hypothetical protein B0H34DRAFT_293036 [Crassisporium funariophilum]